MAGAAHRIRKQRFRVLAAKEADAAEVRRRLHDGLYEKLLRVMEQAFDEVAKGPDVVHIPRLALHLRVPPMGEMDEALPELLREALRAELLRLKAGTQGQPLPAQFLSAAEERHRALLSYLRTGNAAFSLDEGVSGAREMAEALRPERLEEAAKALLSLERGATLDRAFVVAHLRLLALLPPSDWEPLARAVQASATTLGASPRTVMQESASRGAGEAFLPLQALQDAASSILRAWGAHSLGLSGHQEVWLAAAMLSTLRFERISEVEGALRAVLAELFHWPEAEGASIAIERLPEPIRGFFQAALGAQGRMVRRAEAVFPAQEGAEAKLQGSAEMPAASLMRANAASVNATNASEDANATSENASVASAPPRSSADSPARAPDAPLSALPNAANASANPEPLALHSPTRTDAPSQSREPASALLQSQSAASEARNASLRRPGEPSSTPAGSAQTARDENAIALAAASSPVQAIVQANAAPALLPSSSSPSPLSPLAPLAPLASPAPLAAPIAEERPVAAAPLAAAPLRADPSAFSEFTGSVVANAGLILLHPFLGRFFEARGVKQKQEPSLLMPMLPRAAALLCLLATGNDEAHEFELGLIKTLLGLSPLAPLPFGKGLVNDDDRAEADTLLQSTIGHFRALKNTSVDAFRSTFLMRRGLLREEKMNYRLQVAPAPYDMLLNFLPWGIGLARLSWMKKPIVTEWPTS